jgi:phenylalanyl-tRNA synthetase alpha chain
MERELHILERKVLSALGRLEEATQEGLSEETGLDHNSAGRAIYWLLSKGLIAEVEDRDPEVILSLGEEGERYALEELPERRVLSLLESSAPLPLEEIEKELSPEETKIAIGWLRKKGLVEFRGGSLLPTFEGTVPEFPEEKLLRRVRESGGKLRIRWKDLDEEERAACDLLRKRKRVLRVEERTRKRVRLREEGRRLLESGIAVEEEEVTQLTHHLLRTGDWTKKQFRPYDLHAFVPEALPAKLHPLGKILREVRKIFLQMGFREIRGEYVESAFWNFDALFVPQDHPAREMQDTFYLSRPAGVGLPPRFLVERVAAVHENGGGTGSCGWGTPWDPEVAKAALLRTHTTSTTIRHLARLAARGDSSRPTRVFSIGRVFRNEKITFKHLPEFHQVEGIVMGEVNYAHLLGLLKEYYSKMGFDRIRFRPGYFPYTEPSLEVEVFVEKKGGWMELGGAGIFRPEVTQPLGIRRPVLAWGLGLERIAMLRLGLEDIRDLYLSDITWLRRS